MKILLQVACAALLLTVSACAAGTADSHQAVQNGALSQLLLGVWHGIIAPITLIGEMINEFAPGVLPWKFRFYEVRDASVLYDAGFFIGIFIGPSGLLASVTRRRSFRSRSRI